MSAAHNAADVGALIRAERRAQGLTQQALARRSEVSRQWLNEVERGHGRAELQKVMTVLDALGLSLRTTRRGADQRAHDATSTTARELVESIRSEVARGDTDFALRLLANGLAAFGALQSTDAIERFLTEPPSTGDRAWDTLIASSVGRACRLRGVDAPAWTQVPALASWWFPVADPILTARTMQRTPIDLSVKGIWLDERALEVA
jgi:y4mF family transcriptional regulator